MDHLTNLENKSIYIIREAYARFKNISLLWSIGKDSTTMLWIARKAFFGKIPFKVMHIDTSFKFKEIYEFRERYEKEWGLDLTVSRNDAAIKRGMSPAGEKNREDSSESALSETKLACCTALKTDALKDALQEARYKALLLAIRRDEHGIRAKERYFSPRNEDFRWNYQDQPAELWDLYRARTDAGQHLRIHPMLHWTELDIWRYIQREKIPMVDLYFAKNGKRFRSIGCETCCAPVESNADSIKKIIRELETTTVSERSGRAQDKEDAYTMQKLRSLGYM